MPNKYYLIVSLAIIFFIGSYSIFNAGYEETIEEDLKNKQEETIIESSPKENEKIKKDSESDMQQEGDGEEMNIKKKNDKPLTNLVKEISPHPESKVKCTHKIEGIPSPQAIEYHPDGDEFWVSSLMNKNYGLAVFDSETGERREEINLPDGGGVEIAFNSDGSYVYVSQMETGRIFKVDAEDKKIEDIYHTGGMWTKSVNLEEEYIFTSNWSSDDISKINQKTGELIEKISTTRTPRGIYIDDNFLYVAGFANGEIRRHNLKTGEDESLIVTGGAMRDLVGTEKYIYSSDMASETIYRLEKETGEVEKFVETENNPNTIRITDDEKILIVSNRGINHQSGNYNIPGPEWGTVLFYSLEDGKLLDVVVGGNQPTGLATYDLSVVYSNFLDGDLTLCTLPSSEDFLKEQSSRVKNYKQDIEK